MEWGERCLRAALDVWVDCWIKCRGSAVKVEVEFDYIKQGMRASGIFIRLRSAEK
jgi:hypothetical protein